jgi:membrane protein required for beta-lactamase induction
MDETASSSSLGKRLLAIVVLLIAGWILLKWAIGLIMGVATLIVILLAVVGVFWAIRTL